MTSDAVGITNLTGSDVYVPSYGPVVSSDGTRAVERYFAAMFVDLVSAPVRVPYVPFVPKLNSGRRNDGSGSSDARDLAMRWFEAPHRAVAPNHRMMIGACRSTSDDELGVTIDPELVASYSFRQRIDDDVASQSVLSGLDPEKVAYENTAHELTHQWRVNVSPAPPGGNGIGHCAENAFDNPRMFCHMHGDWGDDPHHNGERGDTVMKLHYVKRANGADSEYLTIRRAPEPMP